MSLQGLSKTTTIAFLALTLLAFQNCGDGFAVGEADKTLEDLDDNPAPPMPILIGSAPLLKYSQFESCIVAEGVESLLSCLEDNDQLPDALNQTLLNTCVADSGTEPWNLANCLFKNEVYIDQFRRPRQWDILLCNQEFGQANIAACLLNRGVWESDIDQADINNCIADPARGIDGVERCLRGQGKLERSTVITQHQLRLCEKIVGETSDINITACLNDADLLPKGVTVDDIASCRDVAAVDANVPSALACLRNNELIPKLLQQIHISECIESDSQAEAVNCLEVNGHNYSGLTQALLDSCVSTAGMDANVNSEAHCLRNNDIIDDLLEQADIDLCISLTSNSTYVSCLDLNGLKPDTLTQVLADTCGGLIGDGADLANCFAANGFIPSRFSQLVASSGPIGMRCTGCHGGANPSAGLNVSSYLQLSASPIVIPGDPAGSVLYQRITMDVDGLPQMPRNQTPLTGDQISQIESWILDGAKNN